MQLKNIAITEDGYIEFTGFYGPSVGPLPSLRYKLLGLWKVDDLIIKAYFEIDSYPVRGSELIYHNYESDAVVSHSRANYKYFVVNNVGGMILSTLGKSRTNLKGKNIFAYYPLASDNMNDLLATHNGDVPSSTVAIESTFNKEKIYVTDGGN